VYLFAVKSLFRALGTTLRLLVVDDGTLTSEDTRLLRRHFPSIRIVSRRKAQADIPRLLKMYPNCLKYWNTSAYHYNKKLFDPILFSQAANIILLDADIIFFRKPRRIKQWIDGKIKQPLHMAYNASYLQKEAAISFPEQPRDKKEIRVNRELYLRHPSVRTFNSGILCMPRSCFSLPHIEKILRSFRDYGLKDEWFLEQFTLALLVKKTARRTIALPPDQYVVMQHLSSINQVYKTSQKTICVHYTWLYKHLLYRDGLTLMLQNVLWR